MKTYTNILNAKNAGARTSAVSALGPVACTAAFCLIILSACSDIVDRTISVDNYTEKLVPGDTLINGIPAMRVSAGMFIMGSPESDTVRYYDEVQREVTITKSYYISKYPVTNYQFRRKVPGGLENHPVVDVTWEEAHDFAAKKGGRLPTEAEWEFAARGGDKSGEAYALYSGSGDLDDYGWYDGNSGGQLQSVGQKLPNELGLHDMSGNVYEWCADWYAYHTGEPVTDPKAPESDSELGRISRGGAWDRPARDARSADRAYSHPDSRSGNLGFRIVFDVK
ncbi:MAG: formylglycine-generating enzyme family protein [Chitinispirillia bacterium]|nr:formylglycine-generating enzyme family protein [Chitinispirillia bacterium]MCL2242199.1 formylglycine-generating enzyme family protein [Chitinispirillia bacterium]